LIVSVELPEREGAPAVGVKSYVPGPFHLSTLLNTFTPLFRRVHRSVQLGELRGDGLPHILRQVVSVPLPSEQSPFAVSSQNSELGLNPVQECVLECVQVVLREQLVVDSPLRPALPDTLRLLLDFTGHTIRPPVSKFPAPAASGSSRSSSSNLVREGGAEVGGDI